MMIKRLVLAIILLLCAGELHAQYYGWGRSPQSIRWNSMDAVSGRIIFPDYFSTGAARVASYLGAVRPSITYGFEGEPIKLPVILHTQNFRANGIVMWAPRRMELEAIPDIDSYAEPWLKQLVSHEYRHAVQYGNLYRKFMRPVGWFIGQQAGLISTALVPLWFLEGDAVQTETQMSSFGRALQPSFTIEYRAYFGEGKGDRFPLDKWFCGSFKTHIPNHYQLGYQITAFGRERYGDDMWGRMVDYAARRPYTIFPTTIYLQRHYKTDISGLTRMTFANLRDFWASLPVQENSSALISTPVTSYTTYGSPLDMGDSVVLALKEDMDRPSRVVKVDVTDGSEKRLFYTGNVLTPPVRSGQTLYWSEYRNSTFWEQRVRARVVSYDMDRGTRALLHRKGNAFFPTPYRDGELLSVGYDHAGRYYLEGNGGVIMRFADTVSVHGLCYDDSTGTVAFIGLSDGGMYIGKVDGLDSGSPEISYITRPGRVTVHNLRGSAGRLTFNSIASGRDEIHIYDLEERREYRLTSSRYGSVSPSAVSGNGNVYFTTYTADGYMLAHQTAVKDSMEEVGYMPVPLNVINPPRRKWDVVNIDSVPTVARMDTAVKVKRYRKGLNLFNVHSWAPWNFIPQSVVNESKFDFGFGATVMSQNLLSSTSAYLAYGYSGRYGNHLRGSVAYAELAPKFDVSFEWGGEQLVYGLYAAPGLPPDSKTHFQATGRVYLPMDLGSGHRLRHLTPSVELMHMNALVYDAGSRSFDKGYQRLASTLTYTDNSRMAVRDILPRWGYALKLSSVMAPFRGDFGSLLSVFGRVYLPGVAKHNTLTVRANYQFQDQAGYNFRYKELYPRGADYSIASTRYFAASADYTLPVWYPDLGWNSIVYFKRIRLNAYFDFARFRTISIVSQTEKGVMRNVTSYGGEITFDMHVLRIPVNMTSVGVYIYKPSDRRGVVAGVNLSLPL